MPTWLAMTMNKSPTKQETTDQKPFTTEEVMKSLKRVGDDVNKIVKLHSEEKALVTEFLAVLKQVPQQMFSVTVSTSQLPLGMRGFTQARIDSAGHLILTSDDGQLQVMDLSETKNRNLMMAVVGEIVPKFKDFATHFAEEKIQKPAPVQEIPPPEPAPTIEVPEEVPVVVPEPEVTPVPEE
ncbi:MAG: hypothetical protein NWF03_09120, partial [Candidatus Bathyarchaeota archaeon]|nr:hypothetical protein [Candidatus Bathyarchaeota archaeon]